MTHPLFTTPRARRIMICIAGTSVVLLALHGYFREDYFISNSTTDIETTNTSKEVEGTTTPTITSSSTERIPILVYHKLSSPLLILSKKNASAKKYSVEQDVFDKEMKYIQDEGYTPLTMKSLIEDEEHHSLPNKPIAITFDDGWRSQYDIAFPVLKKYGIPATFYIYTGVIGSRAYMTWNNLQTLVDGGMEIGDHTKNHPHLTKINLTMYDDELVKSKTTLEKNLHVQVSDFAYPYGDYNEKVEQAVKNAGYSSARTSNRSLYNDFSDLYQLNVIYATNNVQLFEDILSGKHG